MPTSAAARAGASSMLSPTIATMQGPAEPAHFLPLQRCRRCNNWICAALSPGSTSAITSPAAGSNPRRRAMASAAPRSSPNHHRATPGLQRCQRLTRPRLGHPQGQQRQHLQARGVGPATADGEALCCNARARCASGSRRQRPRQRLQAAQARPAPASSAGCQCARSGPAPPLRCPAPAPHARHRLLRCDAALRSRCHHGTPGRCRFAHRPQPPAQRLRLHAASSRATSRADRRSACPSSM